VGRQRGVWRGGVLLGVGCFVWASGRGGCLSVWNRGRMGDGRGTDRGGGSVGLGEMVGWGKRRGANFLN